MTSNTSYRRTAILVASLWLLTAFGAIVGNTLLSPSVNAPDYLTTIFSKSAAVTGGMLLWLINDIGIVFIGVLMFPILKWQSESMALGYVSMRILESVFLIVGVIFAMMLMPLSQAFNTAGATDVTSFQAVGSVLKQAQHWFMDTMQLIPLGLGGIILTTLLYKSRLVPRFLSVFGFIGYALLLPCATLTLFGVHYIAPGIPVANLVIPVAVWEIILMPIWLYAKGFSTAGITAKQGVISGKMAIEPTTP
jgi:hypothetical protein